MGRNHKETIRHFHSWMNSQMESNTAFIRPFGRFRGASGGGWDRKVQSDVLRALGDIPMSGQIRGQIRSFEVHPHRGELAAGGQNAMSGSPSKPWFSSFLYNVDRIEKWRRRGRRHWSVRSAQWSVARGAARRGYRCLSLSHSLPCRCRCPWQERKEGAKKETQRRPKELPKRPNRRSPAPPRKRMGGRNGLPLTWHAISFEYPT